MLSLNEILEISAARHNHLCPRQVLGVRIGLAGAQALGLEIPRSDKRLIVIWRPMAVLQMGLKRPQAARLVTERCV